MVILPKLLYLMKTLPFKIPSHFFSSLNSVLLKFLWNQQKPRIKLDKLTNSKETGGIGLPNFKHYYYTSHLSRIIDWHCHGQANDWVALEESLNTALLKFSPSTPKSKTSVNSRIHPITDNTLEIIRHIANHKLITSPLAP